MTFNSDEQRESHIQALIRERDFYRARGESGNAKAVDAELRRLGYEAEPAVRQAAKRPVRRRAEKR